MCIVYDLLNIINIMSVWIKILEWYEYVLWEIYKVVVILKLFVNIYSFEFDVLLVLIM